VPYAKLSVPDPIALGIDVIGLPWLSLLIKLGALAGLTTVILVLLYGQSRIFFTISHDGLLPPMFCRVHARYGTPHLSHFWVGLTIAIVASLVPIDVLGELVSIGTLFAFILVCGAVIYLRLSEPGTHRPFRVPGVPAIPLLGIALCLVLMSALPSDTWLRLIAWLALGLLIYFGYGRHHSVQGHETALASCGAMDGRLEVRGQAPASG
jgi:APA family basic amino acid/polyamine antiporter